MTKEALLKASIEHFKDKEQNCEIVPYTKELTNEGYTYLLLDEANKRNITCAIHYDDAIFEANPANIITSLKNVNLSTREPLIQDNEFVLCKYKDLIFFIKQFSGFNATMGNYMYLCDCITSDKLVFLQEPTEQLGYSSFNLLQAYDNNILPLYFKESSFENGRVFLEVVDTSQQSLIYTRDRQLNQLCSDEIVLHFVNYTRKQVMQYVNALCDYTLEKRTFGIIELPKINEKFDDIDRASQLKGASYEASVTISYNMQVDRDDSSDRYILKAYYQMKATD